MIIRGTDLFSGDLKEKHYLPTDIMDIPIAKQTKYYYYYLIKFIVHTEL